MAAVLRSDRVLDWVEEVRHILATIDRHPPAAREAIGGVLETFLDEDADSELDDALRVALVRVRAA